MEWICICSVVDRMIRMKLASEQLQHIWWGYREIHYQDCQSPSNILKLVSYFLHVENLQIHLMNCITYLQIVCIVSLSICKFSQFRLGISIHSTSCKLVKILELSDTLNICCLVPQIVFITVFKQCHINLISI